MCADEGGASVVNDALRASAIAPALPKAPTVGAYLLHPYKSSAASYYDFPGNKTSLIEFNSINKSYGKRQVLTAHCPSAVNCLPPLSKKTC
jgi:hypothetical protein